MEVKSLIADDDVMYYFRDKKESMVKAWKGEFSKHDAHIQISSGDFLQGSPAVNALVSPINSFGFFVVDGINGVILKQFGQQIQERLQTVIKTQHDGELLVGQAAVIPNPGLPVKHLIAVPTMRISEDVSKTPNAYLSFRAVLLAVHQHNHTAGHEAITQVLVPGLATGSGRMSETRCAAQMLQAYETFVKKAHPSRLAPKSWEDANSDHKKMCESPPEKSGP